MTRKITFFEGWSWFKFNNLGLALGTNLKFCTSVAKGLKLKVRKFWGPNPTFVEVTGEKLVGGTFLPTLLPILNRVNGKLHFLCSISLNFIRLIEKFKPVRLLKNQIQQIWPVTWSYRKHHIFPYYTVRLVEINKSYQVNLIIFCRFNSLRNCNCMETKGSNGLEGKLVDSFQYDRSTRCQKFPSYWLMWVHKHSF